jgi:hypothetical protein
VTGEQSQAFLKWQPFQQEPKSKPRCRKFTPYGVENLHNSEFPEPPERCQKFAQEAKHGVKNLHTSISTRARKLTGARNGNGSGPANGNGHIPIDASPTSPNGNGQLADSLIDAMKEALRERERLLRLAELALKPNGRVN